MQLDWVLSVAWASGFFFKKLPMLSWYVASIENHRPGPCIPEGGDPFYRSLGLWGPAQCVR